jgi:hypothetical protein
LYGEPWRFRERLCTITEAQTPEPMTREPV